MPSVAEYCSATAGSEVIRRAAISASMLAGKVAGSGNPPENVITSVAPARARMAVISPPPSDVGLPVMPFDRCCHLCAHLLTADLTNVRIPHTWIYSRKPGEYQHSSYH